MRENAKPSLARSARESPEWQGPGTVGKQRETSLTAPIPAFPTGYGRRL
jgi:hypothetical protein